MHASLSACTLSEKSIRNFKGKTQIVCFPLWVIRVDSATCALASVIHNTGHYHVRLGLACLSARCARIANERRKSGSSGILPRSAKRRELHPRGRRRTGIPTAPNPPGTCSRSACLGFCPTAVWRTIAQDRRGADHRPLDSRIKGARCATVDRQIVQKLIAIFLASPHIARIRVLLCVQEISAMCVAETTACIEAMPDQPTPAKARGSRSSRVSGRCCASPGEP